MDVSKPFSYLAMQHTAPILLPVAALSPGLISPLTLDHPCTFQSAFAGGFSSPYLMAGAFKPLFW
jgi:hypothetical protein